MQNANNIVRLAFFLVLVFFIFPTGKAFALGPDAGNCSWGDYSKTNTTYVSPQSGENNQVQINAAIAAAPNGGSVFLKSGTYVISGPIIIKSNLTLEGDKDAVVQLKDHAGWKSYNTSGQSILDPIIGAGGAGGGNASHDVVIRCFTIDGDKRANESSAFFSCIKSIGGPHPWAANYTPCENQGFGGDRYHGNGYYTLMYFNGGSNFSVHDMTLKDSLNDGLKFSHLSNVKFYNNSVSGMGHEGVFAMFSHDIEVYNNSFYLQASDGVRDEDCYDYIIHDNEFQSLNRRDSSAGIQIAIQHGNPVYNVQIYRNVFHDIWNGGIWLSTSLSMHDGKYPVEIHHNIFRGNGYSTNSAVGATGGIIAASGASSIIYNNVFDGNYGGGVNGGGSGTKVINNIITGTVAGKYSGAGKGAGVTGASDVNYNCFYNNSGGDGSSSSTNGNGNPLFANQSAGDYHLLSKAGRWNGSAWVTDSQNSPCIDWGIPSGTDSVYGNYSKEPMNNGGRVNAGLWGNTTQASLTGNSPQSPMPPAPKEEDYPKGFTSGGDGGGGTVTPPVPPTYTYDPNTNFPDITPPTPINPAVPSAPVVVAPIFPSLIPGPYDGACMTGDAAKNTAGFIPCGKKFNDPATKWDECEPCNLCHMILMGQLVVEFMIKAAAVAASLALIFAGFIYIFAAGKSELVSRSKLMMKYTLIGFIVIFIAWAITDSLLMTLGYIDPIGGNWYTIC